MQSLQPTSICEYCKAVGEFVADSSSGDYICRECGSVQSEHITDDRAEWKHYEDDDRGDQPDGQRAEVDGDMFAPLTTGIASHNLGSSAPSSLARVLTQAAMKTVDRHELRLRALFARLDELADLLTVDGVVRQSAREILRDFLKKRQSQCQQLRGYKGDPFLAAVLLVACKRANALRTVQGVAISVGVDQRDLKRHFRALMWDADIKAHPVDATSGAPSVQAAELVLVYCSRLKIPFAAAKAAQSVVRSAHSLLEGKRPASIAAAAIVHTLRSMRQTVATKDLCTLANISPKTLRSSLKELDMHAFKVPSRMFNVNAIGVPIGA